MGINIETYVKIAASATPNTGAWRAALMVIVWMGGHSPHDVAEFQCNREMAACQRLLYNADVLSDPGMVQYIKEKLMVFHQFLTELNAAQETMQVPVYPVQTGIIINKGNG